MSAFDGSPLWWQMLPPSGRYGLSMDPRENARAAARYIAARYGSAWDVVAYALALERIHRRHERIRARVTMYAQLADALGEPPSPWLAGVLDGVADASVELDELFASDDMRRRWLRGRP